MQSVGTGFLGLLASASYSLSSLVRIVCGGSAPPRALIEAVEKRLGARFIHAYGMTEANPLTHICVIKSHMAGWPEDRVYAIKARQGPVNPGLEMRGVGRDRHDVPWDGATMGEVWLRGPGIANEYYRDSRCAEKY